MVGDSCGSFIEFIETRPSDDLISECLKMHGGGPHGVGPGQITDDSEMALSLMWALIENEKTKGV